MISRIVRASLAAAALAGAACGHQEQTPAASGTQSTAAPAAASVGPQTPDAGGVIDSVDMFTDASGNYFKPKDLAVHPGDVVRFKLRSGVHNVSFLADSNPGAAGLPAASDYLQLPGQAYDVKINFRPGTYYYQCDAHAALGMKGHIVVQGR